VRSARRSGFAFVGAILAAVLISSRESRVDAQAARRDDHAIAPVAAS